MEHHDGIYLRTAFEEVDAFSLPNIGTFRKVYRSAEVEQNTTFMRPPTIEVHFASSVDEHESVHHFLVKQFFLQVEEAKEIEKRISRSILSSIEAKGAFVLEQIGTLQRDATGTLQFFPVPFDKNLFAKEFYGLQPVQLINKNEELKYFERDHAMQGNDIPVARPETNQLSWKPVALILLFISLSAMVILGPIPTSIERVPMVKNEPTAPSKMIEPRDIQIDDKELIAEAEVNEPKEETQPTARTTRSTPTSIPKVSKENTTPPRVTPKIDDPLGGFQTGSATSSRNNSMKRVNTRELIAANDQPQNPNLGVSRGGPETSTENQPNPAARLSGQVHHLIAGSFGTSKAANDYAQKLRKEGKNATILSPKVGSSLYYRVSIYQSNNKLEVKKHADRLRTAEGVSGWIFTEVP